MWCVVGGRGSGRLGQRDGLAVLCGSLEDISLRAFCFDRILDALEQQLDLVAHHWADGRSVQQILSRRLHDSACALLWRFSLFCH